MLDNTKASFLGEMMNLDKTDLAEDFVRRFDEMRTRGIDVSGVIAEVLRNLLGETPAFAVMYIVGQEAMGEPKAFGDKLAQIFGYSSKIVLEELLSESEKYPPYLAVKIDGRTPPRETTF